MKSHYLFSLSLPVLLLYFAGISAASIIVDHTGTDLSKIPDQCIEQAKATLHIAYQHPLPAAGSLEHDDTLRANARSILNSMLRRITAEKSVAYSRAFSESAHDRIRGFLDSREEHASLPLRMSLLYAQPK